MYITNASISPQNKVSVGLIYTEKNKHLRKYMKIRCIDVHIDNL
jgi:hypothetical protein